MDVTIPTLKKITEDRAKESNLTFDANRDTPKLRKLADQHNIWLGTSSWNYYPGWIGSVYTKERYTNKKGEFVQSRFDKNQIEEYVEKFSSVGNDASYYNPPTEKQLARFAEVLPQNFRMNFKVSKAFTLPKHDWNHPLKGQENKDFLNATSFMERFYNPIKNALGDRVGSFMFEMSPFYFDRNPEYTPEWFVRKAFKFFEQIPQGDVKIGVEVRDPEFLEMKVHRYLDLLEYFGHSHILNEQSNMPPIHDQLAIPGIITSPYVIIARLLVRQFVKHNEAVEEFEPYDRTQLVLPQFRLAMVRLILLAIENDRQLLANLNNRLEGNSPNTIANVLALLEEEMGISL
jgi:uncharacterized protein YecE (DUF72 family)